MNTPATTPETPRVLVIDDEDAVLDMLAEAVTHFGYQTLTARNGAQGLYAVREHQPHVVLLDLNMPGVDGQTLFEHLTSPTDTPNLDAALSEGRVPPVTGSALPHCTEGKGPCSCMEQGSYGHP